MLRDESSNTYMKYSRRCVVLQVVDENENKYKCKNKNPKLRDRLTIEFDKILGRLSSSISLSLSNIKIHPEATQYLLFFANVVFTEDSQRQSDGLFIN